MILYERAVMGIVFSNVLWQQLPVQLLDVSPAGLEETEQDTRNQLFF